MHTRDRVKVYYRPCRLVTVPFHTRLRLCTETLRLGFCQDARMFTERRGPRGAALWTASRSNARSMPASEFSVGELAATRWGTPANAEEAEREGGCTPTSHATAHYLIIGSSAQDAAGPLLARGAPINAARLCCMRRLRACLSGSATPRCPVMPASGGAPSKPRGSLSQMPPNPPSRSGAFEKPRALCRHFREEASPSPQFSSGLRTGARGARHMPRPPDQGRVAFQRADPPRSLAVTSALSGQRGLLVKRVVSPGDTGGGVRQC